jgi:glycosyltransferase involved in cell wall biosynthesis
MTSKLGHEIKIVCNSQFTKNTLLRYYKIGEDQVRIIYPPVKIESETHDNIIKKEEVATIGRFTSVKRQLEQIKIASLVPDLIFNIIGSTIYSDSYLNQCETYIKQHNVKNVHLFPNITRYHLIDILKKSKYFMHNMRNEHFGISTVDAIAYGCIPIVHDSGGQKEIVPFDELRFNNTDEAVQILRCLTRKDNSEILIKLKENINKFSEEKYKEDIISMIKE